LRLLLDTHALIWWGADDERLGPEARKAIADLDSEVFVSAVSALEIATKFRLGKLPGARPLAENFVAEVAEEGFTPLPISAAHGQLPAT
jgi:PIN domain nuclease of toxin-antitoxin system